MRVIARIVIVIKRSDMEQSYKEKYEQALSKAKDMLNNKEVRREDMEYLFPELTESEDEKIREELIGHINNMKATTISSLREKQFETWIAWLEKQGQVKESAISQHENRTCEENGNSLTSEDENVRKALLELVHDTTGDELWIDYNVHKEEALDWLERQGEHANFRNKIQVGDKVTRNENGVLVNLSQLKRVAKPANKVEPKFKIGDKIYLKPEYRMPDDDTPIANTVKEIRRIDDKHYRFDGSYIFIEDQDKYELVEQKPDWSEEDEKMLDSVIGDILCADTLIGGIETASYKCDWLKSLKERIGGKV